MLWGTKSFNIERKSDAGSRLKSLISHHLLRHFSPDLSDHIFADYITVLVCNGKNQNQVRNKLEAFLGDRTQEFISWLWKLLLKNEVEFTTATPSDQKATFHKSCDTGAEEVNTKRKIRDLQSQRNCGSASDNLLDSSKEILEMTIQPSVHHKKLPSSEPSTLVQSSVKKHRTESVEHVEKTATLLKKGPPSLPSRPAASLPGRSLVSGTHSSLCDMPSESVFQRSLTPLRSDLLSHINKSRGSVWDRLGKSLREVQSRGQRAGSCVTSKTRHIGGQTDPSSLLIHTRIGNIGLLPPLLSTPKQIGLLPPLLPTPKQIGMLPMIGLLPLPTDQDNRRVRQVHWIAEEGGSNRIDDSRGANHVDKTSSQVLSVSNIRRKRHFGEVSSQADAAMPMRKRAEKQLENVSPSDKESEAQLAASQDIVFQVQDVKLRLLQMEVEMLKLRSKQLVMEKDGKKDLLTNPGMVKLTQEDIESRTVFVTNVHYSATKDTLSMFFRKCGAVINVDIVTDKSDNLLVPGRNAAYITFESKEAADRALAFSGASFYSRTIAVSKKGGMTNMFPAPSQFPYKKMQISCSKSNVNFDRFPISGSHLQWRRESATSAQTEPLASTSDQAKAVARSACQTKPPVSAVSDMVTDSKQCPWTSSVNSGNTQTLTKETVAPRQELQA